MKYCVLVFLAFLPSQVLAECFVDYKAKKDDPLRLHYGVMRLERCEQSIEEQVAQRLLAHEWQLLTVVNVLSKKEAEEKKESSGEYFLRF